MTTINRRDMLRCAAAALGSQGLRGEADEAGPDPSRMIYLDNAATSFPKPEPVYRAIETTLRSGLANPWQGPYRFSDEAKRLMEGARARLDEFFHGEGPERWAHTFNGTDSLSMAIEGVLKPGNHVVTTDLEHNSVTRPINALEKAGVIHQTVVDSDGSFVDPDAVRKAMNKKTALVVVTHASNLTGAIQPIDAIAAIVREAGSLLLVDAAQSAGQVPINLRRTPIDLLALSGHKALFGPTGTGALYVGPRAEVRPWRKGETGGKGSEEEPLQPEGLPYRLEAGTPNILGIAGLDAGVAWVAERGPDRIRRRLVELLRPVAEWAKEADWRVVGRWSGDTCVGVLSLVPKGRGVKEVTEILDRRYHIATRPGMHEAVPANRKLGTAPDGTLRISPGPLTTSEEIDSLLEAFKSIAAGRD
jgi:cysteine desulfurase/selenocysteine lyase